MKSIVRKIVMITGATSGIGMATAKLLSKHGYNLIITGRRQDKLNDLQDKLMQKYGGEVKTLCFDIRN